MATYLVTGHAGFIGSKLSQSLIRDNHTVVGIDNMTDYYSRRFKDSNLESIKNLSGNFFHNNTDLNDSNEMISVLSNFELSGIFHLAGQPGVRSSWTSGFQDYTTNNISATQKIFEYAKDTIPVVFASSSSVYGNATSYPVTEGTPLHPISPYGLTKKTCEELAEIYKKQFGLRSVALRYFTVYGPGQRPDMAFTKICSSILHNKVFKINGDGTQIRDFTFVDDVVSATIGAMNGPPNAVYNVGGGHEISLNKVIELFEQAAGKELRKTFVGKQAGDVFKTGSDTSLLRGATDWEAQVSITEGIQKQWAWAADHAEMLHDVD